MLKMLDTSEIVGALLLGGLFVVVGLILSWLVRRLLREVLRFDHSERVDQITLSFLSHLTILATWLLLATLYAHLVPALNRLGTALLAGVSLVSVIVGFAAQSTLGNLVAGISLVLHKPFRRGDRLQVAAPTADDYEVGEVEDISLGYTVLRTDDGRQIVIANGTMAQQTMIRLSGQAEALPSSPQAVTKPAAR
jgi:small-conductance mechanosensitive channel